MVDIQNNDNNLNLNVSSSNQTNSINVNSLEGVSNLKINSNPLIYYSNLAKSYSDLALENAIKAENVINEANNTVKEALTKINQIKNETEENIAQQVITINEQAEIVQTSVNEINARLDDELKKIPMSMFDTILKDHILTHEESMGLALQGTYVYREAIAGTRYGYPDFYAKCLEEKNNSITTEILLGTNTVTIYENANGHKYYDISDKSSIDAYYDTTGIAWFYGIDTENERIFLPRNIRYLKLGNIDSVGLIQEAGLPNITGEANSSVTRYSNTTYDDNSAIYATGGSYNVYVGSGSLLPNAKLYLDASRSNSIYGNSNTVDVTSLNVLLYICVGNSVNDTGMTDIINQSKDIIDQFNVGIETRVKLDGSNAIFPFVEKTYINGNSGYRIWSDGWCEQWGISYASEAEKQFTFLLPFKKIPIINITVYGYFSQGLLVGNAEYQYITPRAISLTGFKSYISAYGTCWEARGYIS